MKVLVTGGCGFIGHHLVQQLVKTNSVTVVDNLTRKKPKFIAEATYRILDINEIDKIYDKFDVIYHLAAIPSIDECEHDPKKAIYVNVNGTMALLNKAMRDNSRFIFASTCAVGTGSIYGLSKFTAENLCHYYQHNYRLNSTIFRLFNVYGPGCRGIFNAIENCLMIGAKFEVIGNGRNHRGYIHVEDVVDVLINTNVCTSEIYDVVSPEDFFSVNEILEKFDVSIMEGPMRQGHNYDITKCHLNLGANLIESSQIKHKLEDFINEINERVESSFVPF